MLSDEEKEAIEELKKYRGISFKGADILLKLIKKTIQENDKLKEENKKLLMSCARNGGYKI